MSNIRFTIMDAPNGHKIICQYGPEEIVWREFKTLEEAGKRIALACKRLQEKNENSTRDT